MNNKENLDGSQLIMEGFSQEGAPIETNQPGEFSNASGSPADTTPEPLRPVKIARNDLCPCGSGKKYKKCCGFTSPAGTRANDPSPAEKPAEPTNEQWAELFEVADVLKKMVPWEYFWSSDIITIMLPGREEPVYCTIAGRGGECYAIGVYPDNDAFLGYLRILNAPEDAPPFSVGFDQRCLLCNFGNREDVTAKDREVYQALGLKFRGQNQWVHFRAIDPGFSPWYIDSGQAELLIKTLQNLAMACKHYATGELKVDFDNGQTLTRYYSPEDKLWLNTAAELPPISVNIACMVITDEILIARLKKQKRNTRQLEFDITYFPAPVCENKGDRPYLPRILMLADKKAGMLLDQYMAGPEEIIEEIIIGMLNDQIMKSGRPAAINVRDERTGCYIEDLCGKIDIKLHQDIGVPVLDAFLEGLAESLL